MRRFLEDKPIEARRPSLRQKLVKWSRRHRAGLIATAIVLFVALTLITAVCAYAYTVASAERTRAQQEQALAQQNMQLMLRAVDDMYTGIATQWLAGTGALTNVQQGFLERALEIYEIALQQPETGPGAAHRIAQIHERMAHIRHGLGQFGEMQQSLEKAAAIYEQIVSSAPDSVADRRALAAVYSNLALAQMKLDRHDEALVALNQARQQTLELIRLDPEERAYQLDLPINDLSRAEVLIAQDHVVEAEGLVRQGQAVLDQLRKATRETSASDTPAAEQTARPDPRPYSGWFDLDYNRARCSLLLTDILWRQGRTQEALDASQSATVLCNWLRIGEPDRVDVSELAIESMGQRAILLETSGKLPEAVDAYRKALDLQRQTLKARVSPAQWSVQIVFKQRFTEAEYEEQDAFCTYVETQIRLAHVLRQLDRFYEAEVLLGEATCVGQILHHLDWDSLRYRVAFANAWAEASALLQPKWPAEAQIALAMASCLWRETTQEDSRASSFCSGVRDLTSDWDWFVQTFPQHETNLAAFESGQVPSEDASGSPTVDSETIMRRTHQTGFWQYAAGVQGFEGEVWGVALTHFKRSVQLRGGGAIADWLYLAMTHAKLGQDDEARHWLDKADLWLTEHPDAQRRVFCAP